MKIFILIFFSLPLYAGTLPELIQLTQERAHYIELIRQESHAYDAQVRQAGTLANPNVLLQLGQIESGGPRGDVIDITLTQPLPWFGKRQALIEKQESLKKLGLLEGKQSELGLEHYVLRLALRIAALKELTGHAMERRRRFELLRQSLIARPQLSPIQRVEQGLIENQLRVLERGIVMLESEHRTLSRTLTHWLGREFELELDWSRPPVIGKLEDWEQKLIAESPEYKRRQFNQESLQAELKSAELQSYPDWQFGVNYRQEQLAPQNNFYHAVVGLTLPLFDRGQHHEQRLRAEMKVNEARFSLTQLRLKEQLVSAFERAQSQIRLMKTFNMELINKSERQFKEAENEFRKGRIDAPTFLATDNQIHESIDTAFQTTIDAIEAHNQLRLIVGLSPEI